MRTYIEWHNTVPGIAALPVGTPMYWLRSVGGSCDQDQANFNALTTDQKIAQSSPNKPSGDWQERSCGGTGVDSVDIDAPNNEWKGNASGPIDVVPIVAGDPASYGLTSTFTY